MSCSNYCFLPQCTFTTHARLKRQTRGENHFIQAIKSGCSPIHQLFPISLEEFCPLEVLCNHAVFVTKLDMACNCIFEHFWGAGRLAEEAVGCPHPPEGRPPKYKKALLSHVAIQSLRSHDHHCTSLKGAVTWFPWLGCHNVPVWEPQLYNVLGGKPH